MLPYKGILAFGKFPCQKIVVRVTLIEGLAEIKESILTWCFAYVPVCLLYDVTCIKLKNRPANIFLAVWLWLKLGFVSQKVYEKGGSLFLSVGQIRFTICIWLNFFSSFCSGKMTSTKKLASSDWLMSWPILPYFDSWTWW